MMRPHHRPHTRTQCQEGNPSQCQECGEQNSAAANADEREEPRQEQVETGEKRREQLNEQGCRGLLSCSASDTDSLFAIPSSSVFSGSRLVPPGRFRHRSSMASNMSSVSAANNVNGVGRAILIVELPAEVLVKILNYLSFSQISGIRLVSRRFNEICASMLNTTFQKLQSGMLERFQIIKGKMPRRESARRNHPLARECDIVETMHMRLTLLQMTFGKHIERKHVCFFAGEILDEVYRIVRYMKSTPNLGRSYKVTDELFDLSTMAMEYFKEKLEPTLPEITYFGGDFLDFTTPFAPSPCKRRGANGSVFDSPFSSQESIAGSACSEPWSGVGGGAGANGIGAMANGGILDEDMETNGSNMVLRKRIRKITRGMKKYNDQLVEVKKELKGCQTKMESQSQQVTEYAQRMEEYDKKFEESTRKFQTLLTELNKCKTELQFWRSKSSLLLNGPSSGSLLCAKCEVPIGIPPADIVASPDDDGFSECSGVSADDLKALANQGIVFNEISVVNDDEMEPRLTRAAAAACENPASPRTRASIDGPASPRLVCDDKSASGSNVNRKKRSLQDEECTRKSLRGNGVKNVRGAAKKAKTTVS